MAIAVARRRRCARQHADGVARTHHETKDGGTAGHICFDGNNWRFTLSLTVAKKEQPQEDYNLRFRDQDIVFATAPTDRARDRISKFPPPILPTTSTSSAIPPTCRSLRSTASCSCRPRTSASATESCRWSWWCRAASASRPRTSKHAETVVSDGFAAFVLDCFGARDVTSTVANQTQFSFAASAYDVLAAWQVLSDHPEIDASRIGAQGHSRGGSAVLTAATRRFADAVVGAGAGFRSVLAAYPWSGHQFLDPRVDEPKSASSWAMPMNGVRRCRCRAIARRSASPAEERRCG